ncbi:type II toxin-antitoxin system death-on-curing family toxin [Spongiibacter nanhainus]|uniref:Type II toxin-antitoxin system death-on-curing family toxin n=1 Tax=Spongiibacter nanhainus TaxID=2794344 RepID=A0A7T4QXL2_9GAMM|nr:type II toxin-antitoxin system death-on-curing family toxin [Spongiibacter nanhainus]QQD16660.1 type II toxin-antitoxin system death-on-curing family toxin [Spongiibacter nanhainus]
MSTTEYCDGSIRYLSPQDIEDINSFVILSITPEEPIGVIENSILHGAQSRPSMYRYYEETNDMATLAAVLLTSTIKAHAFLNGNKRTAFVSAVVFLRINGYRFDPPLSETLTFCKGIAEDQINMSQVAYWIATHSRPSDSADLLSDCLHIVFSEYEGFRA